MSEIEQIQKDVDKILIELDTLINSANLSQAELDELKQNLYERYYDISDTELLFNQLQERFGLDKDNADKFNFAVITKIEDDIEYQEFWIMANAYYDYVDGYFHKMDMHNTSFGIQIQGKGAFPGEAQLGYYDNSGINVWRNPSLENLDWATTEQKRCLVETGIIGEYDSRGNIKTFQVSCGWNNAFMFDSYGGMTIGGTGFEIDGNGIFPYTRVANCLYTNPTDNKEYGYIALLHNAYNSTRFGWDCDSNRTYSWLMGIHAPVDETLGGNNLDLTQADFRVMYNDTPWNGDDTHELDISKWHTILKVDMDSIESMVNGTLTTLGTYVHPTTKQCDYAYTHPTTKQCNYTPDLSNYVTNTQLSDAINDVTSETGSIYLTKANANNTYLSKTTASSTYLTQSNADNTYLKKTDAQSTYAPIDHSSTNTNYGVATSNKYGHAKASTTTPSTDTQNGSSGSANGEYANADHSHPQSSLYAPAVHTQNTDTINIAGTQNKNITGPIKSMVNALNENNFYHIFNAIQTTTWGSMTIYQANLGDMTYKPTFTDGNLCTVAIRTNSSVTGNVVKLYGTSNGSSFEYYFTMEKDGWTFEDTLQSGQFVLCIIDATNFILKVVGVY